MPKTDRKEERRGGARDDSEIYVNYTADQLVDLFARIKRMCDAIVKRENSRKKHANSK